MFRKNRKHIFITCSPKSGSTYLLQLLSKILDYEIEIFIPAFDRTEQNVFEAAIIKNRKRNTVTHQHTKCTKHNLKILDKYSIKPIVLTRDIYQSVISMRNHMLNEPENSWWSMAYVDENFYSLSPMKQLDFVIDLIVPWYINFYVSWFEHSQTNNILWITYSSLLKDKINTIKKILEYYDIEAFVDDEVLKNAENLIEGKTRKTRKNNIELSQTQKVKIDSYFEYYPNINFDNFIL
jgi:hypothetical protein